MNLLVKIYMKRYNRHNKTLWTTDFIQKSSSLCSYQTKLWPTQIWHVSCSGGKKKVKKNAFRWGLPICHKLWDIQYIVLINNSRTVWPTEILMSLSFSHNLLQDAYIIFQSNDKFEIVLYPPKKNLYFHLRCSSLFKKKKKMGYSTRDPYTLWGRLLEKAFTGGKSFHRGVHTF